MTDSSRGSGSIGMDHQLAIYEAGMRQERPAQPVSIEELEARAEAAMSAEAWGYLAGGAGGGDTMRANLEAFRRWRLVPRHLRDVSRRDLSVEVLHQRLAAPILLAPVGVQGIFHPGGEVASAEGAAALGIPVVLSTVSSKPMEEVAAAMGEVPRWFQLYWSRDRELAASMLERAERAGFSAVVLTIDLPLLAWRESDLQNAYLPFLFGEGIANYLADPVFRAALERSPEEDPAGAIRLFSQVFSNPSLTWEDLGWLRDQTDLPIVLKGILEPDDARRALDHGAAGVVVSNHGGRQVDGSIAALDALPGVVGAVADAGEVLFDSGIRRGADVLKATALGASAVLVGRPFVYGLTVGGADGVRNALLNLLADLDLTLGLVGCTSFRELGTDHLRLIQPTE